MRRWCDNCKRSYDDERRSTICPHKGIGYCEKCDCVVCVCVVERGEVKNSYISVILANLEDEDNSRFHAAGLRYSGSTGIQAKPKDYAGLAPYIATSLDQLVEAMGAMRWHNFTVEMRGNQWIVRRTVTKKHSYSTVTRNGETVRIGHGAVMGPELLEHTEEK